MSPMQATTPEEGGPVFLLDPQLLPADAEVCPSPVSVETQTPLRVVYGTFSPFERYQNFKLLVFGFIARFLTHGLW